MSENLEIQSKKESKETVTESYLKGLDPELWGKLSSLSSEQRDQRWFDLTQSHLRDYRAGKLETEKFKLEELEFLYLNQWNAKEIPALAPEMLQRGFSFTPERGREKFQRFEDFIESVKRETKQHLEETSRSFWILVGGIGISGKATLRSILTKELTEKLFQKRIISWDRDYQKIFPPKWQGDINIIEDVHGLDEGLKRFDGTEGVSGGYDMVLYSLPPAATYRQTLTRRGVGWLEAGKMDLTAPDKEYPPDFEERIKQTATKLEETLQVGSDWFKEQRKVLKELKKRGVKIVVVDPTEIFKKLYNFEEKPGLPDKSFLTALEETFRS